MTEMLLATLKSAQLKRFVLFGVIALLGYYLSSFKDLFLTLFIVTFVMHELCKYTYNQVSKVTKTKVSEKEIIVMIYSLIILFLVIVGIKYVPAIIIEAKSLLNSINITKDFNQSISSIIVDRLSVFDPSIKSFLESNNFGFAEKVNQFFNDILLFSAELLKGIGKWSLDIFMIIILSLFFLLEKNKMMEFAELFKESKISFVYNELTPVLVRFNKAFGAIIKAQLLITFINMILTIIALAVLGFPNLFALGLLILLFGLIPVVGAIISAIPLVLIGYSIGGIQYVVYVLIITVVIHSLGTYLIFPKILSNFTHMPNFLTLIILIISEHLFGIWGLIYGLPLFIFAVESLKQQGGTNKLM